MTPYASLAVAGLVLFAFPGEVFGRKGLRSIQGFLRYVGHAAVAGAPGALWLWASPGDALQALALTVGMTFLVGTCLLLPGIRVEAAPARGRADRPAPPATGAISPWELQGLAASATVTTPSTAVVRS